MRRVYNTEKGISNGYLQPDAAVTLPLGQEEEGEEEVVDRGLCGGDVHLQAQLQLRLLVTQQYMYLRCCLPGKPRRCP